MGTHTWEEQFIQRPSMNVIGCWSSEGEGIDETVQSAAKEGHFLVVLSRLLGLKGTWLKSTGRLGFPFSLKNEKMRRLFRHRSPKPSKSLRSLSSLGWTCYKSCLSFFLALFGCKYANVHRKTLSSGKIKNQRHGWYPWSTVMNIGSKSLEIMTNCGNWRAPFWPGVSWCTGVYLPGVRVVCLQLPQTSLWTSNSHENHAKCKAGWKISQSKTSPDVFRLKTPFFGLSRPSHRANFHKIPISPTKASV